MPDLKNEKFAIPLVIIAGILWSFGPYVVRHIDQPQIFPWQYLFTRGIVIFLLLNIYLYLEEGRDFINNYKKVGKSGIIGQKISSTLASVGIPSFYVDAASCSHGDLGKISSNDVLILISFSGESSELKNIIQYSNRNKNTLIGITTKKNSLLYKASDIKLLTPRVIEAEGIVPTSSTTTQLALGDEL